MTPAAAAHRRGTARVRVPATSANLGPGFDSFGLALTLYDEVDARVSDEHGVRVHVDGEAADRVPRDFRHLVAATMLRAFDVLGGRPPGLELSCANRIPHGRGLGSSAAAIVSGLLLARALVDDGEQRLPDDAVLDLASSLEGHPDNVAACLLGGATVAWSRLVGPPTIGALRLVPAAAIVPVVCVPATSVPTRKARGMLPESVPHADAAANSARAALLVAALTSRPDLLFEATVDRLHQSYRRSAFPASLELVEALRSAGIAAVISGAGPTVLALTDAARAPQVGDAAGAAFDTLALASDLEGACVQYDD